jgi:uncharacterized protein HemX
MQLVILLTALIIGLTIPAWAQDQSAKAEEPLSLEQLDLAKAKRFIEQLYKQGMEALQAIEDHVELKGSFRPEQSADQQGYLSLRLYPKGKAHAEDSMTAETWFGFASKPDEDRLHFDFKFSKDRKPTAVPQRHI